MNGFTRPIDAAERDDHTALAADMQFLFYAPGEGVYDIRQANCQAALMIVQVFPLIFHFAKKERHPKRKTPLAAFQRLLQPP